MKDPERLSIADKGLLDGLANKPPAKEYMRSEIYKEAYFKGFWQYHSRRKEITGGNNN